MTGPDWIEALPMPPSGGTLSEAWFTTFDQPDAGFLVEHLLPSLLGVGHSLSHELEERTLFFGELAIALERLRGRITVVSSPAQTQAPQYPWLWRYMSHFTVGAASRATQHSKLWAFHWTIEDEERLDLYVSSANLTASAFKKQLQAGWKASLLLGGVASPEAQLSWGDLVAFFDALGVSAGANAKNHIDRLTQLLSRAKCPEGVMFIASMPGSEKRGTHALKKLAPSAIHILTPTVGDWTKETLTAWSKDVGVATDKVHLKWLDADRPWVNQNQNCWTLTEAAEKVLRDKGVQLNQLPPHPQFSGEHVDGDERWSHAKLYLLTVPRRKKRQLLVTSANWSVSAWGAGKGEPARNFELGVLLETDWKDLEKFGGALSAPFCATRSHTGNSTLHWAEASWDGKRIELRARNSDPKTAVRATISFSSGAEKQVSLVNDLATLPWQGPDVTPLTAQFSQGAEPLEVSVIDLRPSKEFSKTPLPEVDSSVATALRDAFLLERYGGLAVDIESIFGRDGARLPVGGAVSAADYSVQAWLEARAAFGVVDSWQSALDKAKVAPSTVERLWLDGKELRELYARRKGPAADLVVEELGWRLGKKA